MCSKAGGPTSQSSIMHFTSPLRRFVLLSMGDIDHQEVAVIRTFCHSHSDFIHCPGKQTLLLATTDVPYQCVGFPRACVTE